MGRWADLFAIDESVWLVGLPPGEAIRAIADMYDSLFYRRRISGSHVVIATRRRGGTCRVEVGAYPLPGGSRVEAKVIPGSAQWLRWSGGYAVLAAIATVLYARGLTIDLTWNFTLQNFRFVFAAAAVLLFVQFLLMGVNRNSYARRFARRMAAINATRVEQPLTTTR